MRGLFFLEVLLLTSFAGAVPLELNYIYPMGCKQGESCQLTVGGNWAGSAIALGCSGEGVKAEYVGVASAYLPKESPQAKGKQASNPTYVAQPLPGHSLMNLTMDAQAEQGLREIYVDYRYEVTDPLKFEISDYREIVEPATNQISGSSVALEALPVCLNGRVFGEKPDRYSFQAESGQTLVAFLKSELVPPGGFIPKLQVADDGGSLVTNGVTVYFPDSAPVLVFQISASASYSLLISGDGTQDGHCAVYRIVFGELPLITDFSPKLAMKGKSLNLRLEGVNLAAARVRLFTGGKDSAMCMRSIAGDSFVLPGLNFDLFDESIVSEVEPNNSADEAQAIAVPAVVNGAIDKDEQDSDFYSFTLAAGAEAYADVSVPYTSVDHMPEIKVKDPSGNSVLMENNMSPELRNILQISTLSFACRSDEGGLFSVKIARKKGDSRALDYRLRVAPPAPDYSVWMTPVAINMPINGSCLIHLFVHRKHGYIAPVSVAVAFPPLGVLSSGGVIASDRVDGLVTVWTDAYRNPRHAFYQELMATSIFNGVTKKKPVMPFRFSKGEGGVERPVFFEKPPARIAYNAIGMVFDEGSRSGVVLTQKEEGEVELQFKNVPGSVSEDYEYMIIEPAQGVVVLGQIESTASDVVRLRLALNGKGELKPGFKGFMIIGMVKKGEGGELITASQAVPFSCK